MLTASGLCHMVPAQPLPTGGTRGEEEDGKKEKRLASGWEGGGEV